MKQIKKILSLIAVLALLLTLLPAAFADGEEDARFRDKTWEEVVRAFLEENGVDADRLGCGYYNTVSTQSVSMKVSSRSVMVPTSPML